MKKNERFVKSCKKSILKRFLYIQKFCINFFISIFNLKQYKKKKKKSDE